MFLGSCLFPALSIVLLVSTSEARCFVNHSFCSRKARKFDYNKGRESVYKHVARVESIHRSQKAVTPRMPGIIEKQVVSKIVDRDSGSQSISVELKPSVSDGENHDIKLEKELPLLKPNPSNRTSSKSTSPKYSRQKRNRLRERKRKRPSPTDKGSVHLNVKNAIYSRSPGQLHHVSISTQKHFPVKGPDNERTFSHIVFKTHYKKRGSLKKISHLRKRVQAILDTNNGHFYGRRTASAAGNFTRRNKSARDLKAGNAKEIYTEFKKQYLTQNGLFDTFQTSVTMPVGDEIMDYLERFNETNGTEKESDEYQTKVNDIKAVFPQNLFATSTKLYELPVEENDHFIDNVEKQKYTINTPLVTLLTSEEDRKMSLSPWISGSVVENPENNFKENLYPTNSIYLSTTLKETAFMRGEDTEKTKETFQKYSVPEEKIFLKDFLPFVNTDGTNASELSTDSVESMQSPTVTDFPTANSIFANNIKEVEYPKDLGDTSMKDLVTTSTVYPVIPLLPNINYFESSIDKNNLKYSQEADVPENFKNLHLMTGVSISYEDVTEIHKKGISTHFSLYQKEDSKTKMEHQTTMRTDSGALDTWDGFKNNPQKHVFQTGANASVKFLKRGKKLDDPKAGTLFPNSAKLDETKPDYFKSEYIRPVVESDTKHFHPVKEAITSNTTVPSKIQKFLSSLKKLLIYSKAKLLKLPQSGRKDTNISSHYNISGNDFKTVGKSAVNQKEIQYEIKPGINGKLFEEQKAVDTIIRGTEDTSTQNPNSEGLNNQENYETSGTDTIMKVIFGTLGFAFICFLTASIYFTAIKYTNNHNSAKSSLPFQQNQENVELSCGVLKTLPEDDVLDKGFYDRLIENKHQLTKSLEIVLKNFKPCSKDYLVDYYSSREHVRKIRNAISGIIK